MISTIRHDTTGRTLVAYLGAIQGSRTIRHIIEYMQLLHYTPSGCTRVILADLAQRGLIARLQRGRYQQVQP